MRLGSERESSNVEDRRGLSRGGGVAIGGGLIGVIFLVIKLLSGGDVSQDLPQEMPGQTQQMTPADSAKDEERARFVKKVLALTEDVWDSMFAAGGKRYVEPTLVLFRDRVESACGMAGAASGPFYCPGDQKVYIDLAFYEELEKR